MSIDTRVYILLVVVLVSPSLQWSRHSRQVANVESEDCKTPNNVPGQCINIKSCPVMLKMLMERRHEPDSRKYLIDSRCGAQTGRVIKVCCPDTFQDTSQCGRSNILFTRVVNGEPAVLGAWPWMAALGRRSDTFAKIRWMCGGTLITNKHVLTAAHCVTVIGSKQLVVRLGDLNLDDDVLDGATPINVSVKETIVHENFENEFKTNDIALVVLARQVDFTEFIRPLCVPTPTTFGEDLTRYVPFVAGWGATGYMDLPTTALQQAQIEIVDQDFCKQALQSFKINITDRVICALSSVGKDTCQGDSGGPLILPKSNIFYTIGIVSQGYRCADNRYPAIYTKVPLYTDWITRMTRS